MVIVNISIQRQTDRQTELHHSQMDSERDRQTGRQLRVDTCASLIPDKNVQYYNLFSYIYSYRKRRVTNSTPQGDLLYILTRFQNNLTL